MAMGGQADDAAVAEEIVLAVHQEDVVSEVVVLGLVVVGGDALVGVPGLPLATLHDEPRIRDLMVPAGVVVVQVRVDEIRDGGGGDVERGEPGAYLVTRSAVDVVDAGDHAETPS